jgi:hypothetical protein
MTQENTLELSWWLQDPPPAKELPPSSLMSFTKHNISYRPKSNGNSTGQLPTTVGSKGAHAHTEVDILPQCVIQIGSVKLVLHAKWLPLMMMIQMNQAAALQASIQAAEKDNLPLALTMQRLTWFYDFLLKQFAQDAKLGQSETPNTSLAHNWMPEYMHRCLTRINHRIPHTPESLLRQSCLPQSVYQSTEPFCYGERCWLSVFSMCII